MQQIYHRFRETIDRLFDKYGQEAFIVRDCEEVKNEETKIVTKTLPAVVIVVDKSMERGGEAIDGINTITGGTSSLLTDSGLVMIFSAPSLFFKDKQHYPQENDQAYLSSDPDRLYSIVKVKTSSPAGVDLVYIASVGF